MANEPIRSMKNQMYNYGIGRAFADNRPVTRGQMARAAIPESTSLIDEIKRLQMAGGLSGRNQLVENKAYTLPSFSLPNDIFSATEEVVSTAKGTPSDFEFVPPPGYEENLTVGERIEPGTIFSTDDVETSGRQGNLGTKVIPSDLAGGRGDLIEGLTERADYLAGVEKSLEKSRTKQEKSFDQPDKGDPVTNAFMAGMDEFIKSARDTKSPDATEVRNLDDYKREFADATGLDISGKVDKSQALMAFGLALMQNRAGKGFNVGKMLRAVGEAGEAAMPELDAARKEARANAAAAGKYALDMRSADQEKAIAAAMAAQQRGKYYIMPKSEGASGFLSVMDEARPEFLNATELNALVTNPEFSQQYDVITEERFATIVDAALESPESPYDSKYVTEVSLLGDEDGISNLFTFKVQNATPGTKAPSILVNANKEKQVADALGAALRDFDAAEDEFAQMIAFIDDGAADIPSQVRSGFLQLLDRFGFDIDSNDPTAQLEKFLTRFQAENASDILGESGKTLSDTDRKLVAEIVGQLPTLLAGSEDTLRARLVEMKERIIDKNRRKVVDAYATLDLYTPKTDYSSLYQDGPDWSPEKEELLIELRKKQGAKA